MHHFSKVNYDVIKAVLGSNDETSKNYNNYKKQYAIVNIGGGEDILVRQNKDFQKCKSLNGDINLEFIKRCYHEEQVFDIISTGHKNIGHGKGKLAFKRLL
jgi:hypothetical protein